MFSSNKLPAGGASRRGWLKKLGGLLAGGALLGKSQPAAASALSVASVNGLDSFLSEIMLVSFNFAPKGWALCNGQFLPINQNLALFSLLGTTYGGNGQTTFALPDLRGRVIVGNGATGYTLGQTGGEERHVLLAAELPPHAHGMKVSTDLGTTNLSGASAATPNYLADNGGGSPQYGTDVNTVLANAPGTTPVNISSAVGGSQSHENRQPFLTLNYVICLQGIFPSPN